ncbi:hypothetical protein [Brevundimonas sp. PAMC22021]|uniref:hypothetical protein n=1 Tax=Brevundimonas sp. PAMC22021 TaxID=2861285 RepID=UPI001C62D8FD|nr:hypothetical protein [Brevundimonas sp. PAMC22021]QYF87201.1 hypothetical protein KY493_01375 [Brevundimonas sp. PAMC22021]
MMAKAKAARWRGLDRVERVEQRMLGVLKVLDVVKTIEALPDGPEKRRRMALVDRMVADIKRIPL